MREEIEFKFPVRRPQQLRRQIRALGFRPAGRRTRERNWIFDQRGRLRRADALLRLRQRGRRWLLTVKGKRRPGPLKRRPELETAVADGEACRGLLELLGYRSVMCYERFRTLWRHPAEAGELAWDETPFGVYLEIEGTAAWVRRTARGLGFKPGDAETRSYPELYAAFARRKPTGS